MYTESKEARHAEVRTWKTAWIAEIRKEMGRIMPERREQIMFASSEDVLATADGLMTHHFFDTVREKTLAKLGWETAP